MSHFKAFGTMNLQYEVRIYHKIHEKGTMSKFQYKLLSFYVFTKKLIASDVMYKLGDSGRF